MPKKISRPPASEPSDSKKRTTVTLPASLHKATKQRALDDDCDFSDVVAAALRDYPELPPSTWGAERAILVVRRLGTLCPDGAPSRAKSGPGS
ncbi:hypothetical protein [Paraliomyxa miuraensis]|uniref:hypothetical protein n=1 Tax=Paraliomyxa miuraensis TaxID=376150 RepID=UPI00224EAB34|nr:hypothetical protein [Paraliomyxa miuraensis]MCX4247516.1 hypothetical protein [Paraliomyxa miuraensis]